MQADLDKKARLAKEKGMMEEMRKQKEQADGGIDAVKKALENQKTETLKAFQQMQQAEAEKKDALRKLKEAEDRLQAYTRSTDGELRVLRWLVQQIAKEQKQYISTAPMLVVDTAKSIYVAGAEAAAADPAGTLAALGVQMPANAPGGGVLSPRSSALVAQGGASRSMTPSKRERIQRERALMHEFASKTKSEDPLSRSLGNMANTIIQSQEAMPLTHSIAMADEKELLDWNYWAKQKDTQEALATPAGQLAMKHQRKQKPLTALEQRLKDEEDNKRNARPENQAMSQLQGYAQQVSGLLEGVLAVSKWSPSPSPAAAASPSPTPQGNSTYSPSPMQSPPTPAVSALMPPANTPATFASSLSPGSPTSPSRSPAAVEPTPRSTKRQQRQLAFTLTLREVEAAVRICKGALIPTDSEEYSQRMHLLLMGALNPGQPIMPLQVPKKNTEPVRDYIRMSLARKCCGNMNRVIGEDGDRKEWTQEMFDKALELLSNTEQECQSVLVKIATKAY